MQLQRVCHDTLPWLISISLDVVASATMSARHWIRIMGAVVVACGLLCLPSIGRSPRSYGSGFAMLSDTGSLIWIAGGLLCVGAILFIASFRGGQ